MKTLPLTEAKNRFSKIVDAVADRDERVLITRNGRRAALMINPDELDRLLATLDVLSDPDLMAQIRQSRKDFAAGRYRTYTDLDEAFGTEG